LIPEKIVSFDFSGLGKTFGQCFNVDFGSIKIMDFVVVMFAFLFVDLFDTLGTLIGVATKAKMLDKDGRCLQSSPLCWRIRLQRLPVPYSVLLRLPLSWSLHPVLPSVAVPV
jgi:xanthine/uracil/vitamin C permease (AzgA family)